MAAAGITGAAAYVLVRARDAVHHGLHPGPDEAVPVRMTVAQVRRDKDGRVTLKGLRIEGPAGAVSDTLRTLLGAESSASAVNESRPRIAAGGTHDHKKRSSPTCMANE